MENMSLALVLFDDYVILTGGDKGVIVAVREKSEFVKSTTPAFDLSGFLFRNLRANRCFGSERFTGNSVGIRIAIHLTGRNSDPGQLSDLNYRTGRKNRLSGNGRA